MLAFCDPSSIWLSTRPRPFASPVTYDPRQTALVWLWWAVFWHFTIVNVSFLETLCLPGSLLLWGSSDHARSRNTAGTLKVFRFDRPSCSPRRQHGALVHRMRVGSLLIVGGAVIHFGVYLARR